MDHLSQVYATSLALNTDLYQLTMAYAAWKTGSADREAVFHLNFRRNPFRGGYAVACGVEPALDLIASYRFTASDLDYLAGLRGGDGRALFEEAFLEYLRALRLSCDVDAVREGTVVFPHQPLLRVQGPIVGCMLLETPLLNLVNFQTLIATKAARMVEAAAGDPVVEFGLRRAQGIDGALSAARAAYVGGVLGTSNTLAGKLYGIPVRGTHAHSWVMIHDTEVEAFERYAEALPNNCLFLVDTFDTLQGVHNAIELGRRLRHRGHELIGVRLDSGDLAYLSIEARRLLDEAGFPEARIFATNDLDEHLIQSLKQQGAQIGVWGVGTRLVTAHDDPALGGVYKLSAIRRPGGPWEHRVKLSEQAIKVSTPGILQVRRFTRDGEHRGDMVFDLGVGPDSRWMVDPLDPTRQRRFDADERFEDLLRPAIRAGARVAGEEPLSVARERCRTELTRFHAGVRRFVNPHQYPVGLERGLHALKMDLILKARGLKQ